MHFVKVIIILGPWADYPFQILKLQIPGQFQTLILIKKTKKNKKKQHKNKNILIPILLSLYSILLNLHPEVMIQIAMTFVIVGLTLILPS